MDRKTPPHPLRPARGLLHSPARISILGFLILILIGTGLLLLPQATPSGAISFTDALFTATSASCVTGLIVRDTGTDFTRFGQGVILGLIQAGGLGIMTLSTLFLLIAGRRPTLVGRVVIQDTFTHAKDQGPTAVIRNVVLLALVIETLGGLLLFFVFVRDHAPDQAAYIALFHTVSAFCNAGFSLFSDSLSAYRGDWLLNVTVGFLIITGGLGFLVLSEVLRTPLSRPRQWGRMSLHSKLVLSATAILLVGSTLLILGMEWRNTLAGLPIPKRVAAAFFQAATTRTAGFNTLPIDRMANATLFLFIILMFIGASPGSCGGGAKTTTITALFLLGFSKFRAHQRPNIFSRTISEESIGKAMSVVLASLTVILVGTMLLLSTELGEISHPLSRGKFLDLFFEVVSAFGTVGLSTGVTPGLTTAGKLIITATMFIGRLGPLVIAIAVARQGTPDRYYYAKETIMVG